MSFRLRPALLWRVNASHFESPWKRQCRDARAWTALAWAALELIALVVFGLVALSKWLGWF